MSMTQSQQQIHEAYEAIKEKWNTRPSAWLRVTADYIATQRRFLPLVLLHHSKRFDVFIRWAKARELRWSTISAYWTAILTLLNALDIRPEKHETKNASWLALQCQQEVPTAAIPMTRHDAQDMWRRFPDAVSLGILVAFVLGQRISDALLLRRERIRVVFCQDRGTPAKVELTFVEGKTIRYTGPYTLYLDAQVGVGNLLARYLAQTRAHLAGHLLFPQETAQLASIRLAQFGLENRSVRRGGLQEMAHAGISIANLLRFSKHTSEKMLYRYLGYRSEFDATQVISDTHQTFYTPR